MPSVIRTAVQNLIGGVSQQPNSVRLENQCEVQDNAYSSVVDGLGKRQPTEHIRRLLELEDIDPATSIVHFINRDSTERYAVIIDTKQPSFTESMQIFDLTTGEKINVFGRDKDPVFQVAWDYLRNPAPGDPSNDRLNLKLVTVSDVTYILNKSVVPERTDLVTDFYQSQSAGETILSSRSSRRHFIFLPNANASTKYAVRMNVKYHDNHPGAFAGKWDPPIDAEGGTTRDEWIEFATGWVKTFALDHTRHPDPLTPPGVGTGSNGYGDADSAPSYVPLSPWVANGLHEGYQIPTVNAHEVIDQLWNEIREGRSPRQSGEGTVTATYYPGGIQSCWTAEKVDQSVGSFAPDIFYGAMVSTWNVDVPKRDAVMCIHLHETLNNQPDFREDVLITVEGRGDSQDLVSFGTEVNRFSELPTTCVPGHIVRVTGLEDTDEDDYYVRFEQQGNEPLVNLPDINLVQGTWRETTASLSVNEIDNDLMPMTLTRIPDVTETSGFYFEFHFADWTDRDVGDDESNPPPSFIGEPITDIFLWRNRLGFLTGSRLVMSEADRHLNFWRTTVRQILDSDVIDVDVGHNRVANLQHATALEDDLVLWSDRTQFLVTGSPILTPRTVSVAPMTEFENFPTLSPLSISNGVFYGFTAGGGVFSQLGFYRRRGDVSDTFESFPSTQQVPRYLRGSIVEMAASSLEGVLAVRTDDPDGQNVIYIHKWLDRGADRILSSWMRYIIGDETDSVAGMEFIDDELHLIMRREASLSNQHLNLEKITFSGQRQVDQIDVDGTPGDAPFRCMLDRRVQDDSPLVTVTQSVTIPYTLNIKLPWLSGGKDIRVVSRSAITGPVGEQFKFTQTNELSLGQQVTVLQLDDADQALFNALGGFKFWIGETYEMFYEFTEPTLREHKQNGSVNEIKTGRFQMLRGSLSYEDTGFFQMHVGPALHSDGTPVIDRDVRTQSLPLLEVGLGRSKVGAVNVRDGVMKFGIYSAPEYARLFITNDSPYPCNPKALELESNYSRRSRMSRF